ncbi:uncharacterized protein LOC110739698 isoform X1 [Chenopodium quinoa]|uniref:uncharacterized protein LOC110739698 isoform X1 n=2 Tax=Chenopodium quinoa TaxID=63459 RepID=UPI000B786CD9|nr:uncharacterized protein LOC110739698 isoform X1 [Chenopodium quinoa]
MAASSIAATSTNSLDSSLWFDSFSLLLTDLENLSPSSSDLPPSLIEKLKQNHAWFLNTVTQFKPPSEASKSALNSEQVSVGSHKLSIKPQFKELALKLSSTVCLDEIQSYILVERSMDQKSDFVDGAIQGFLHEIVLQYYTQRQCLLKCARQMIIHGLNVGSSVEEEKAIWHEVSKLISDGLESKLISILDGQLSSSFPQQMDVDLFILWGEEILIEANLILDILFLVYYESFSTCSASKWKDLCLLYKDMTAGSSNFVKLGVSAEACKYCYLAKIQMLLILIEALDFESLLQMIHDEIPFSKDSSCVFSSSDILEMDSVISSFDIYETKEAGPLILAWAVFLCLIVSLPGKEEHSELTEVDHVGYVRQAFESSSLSIFMEILQSDVMKDSDGPLAGYRSILRTFVSAFIASYEINTQLEDDTFRLILNTLCETYRGEESLCVQFWDKGSIVDGPVRCLLCNLEGEFPYRTIELTRFLTAVSEGCWPAECVYNFMEKSVGISSVVEIDSDLLAGGASQLIETQIPLHVPTVEGLLIPSKTRGRILRMIDSKTALVRWEYKQSGMVILLLRLAQMLELNGNEEVLVILDLFSRVVSFNMDVCFSMMNIGKSLYLQTSYGGEHMEGGIWIDMVEVLCNLVRNLSPYSGSVLAMSMTVNILAKMMKGSPSHVSAVVLKMNIFDLSLKSSIFNDQNSSLSSGSWLLSGRLAKMLLIDCEHNGGCPLTISVLEFTQQLLGAGVENEFSHALVMFCLQYVFVNHEYWKYKVKQDRWNVTLKVLEVLKMSIISVLYLTKLGGYMKDIILSDSSIHGMILRIICTTSPALEKLNASRLYDWREIDGLQHAIASMLDILVNILSTFPEDDYSGLPVFYQALLSNSTKPIPVVEALASLISYFRNPAIQLGATTALSLLCRTADRLQPYLSGNANFGLGAKQVMQLRSAIESIIREQPERNEPLFVAAIELLTSAATHQPAFLAAIFAGDEIRADHLGTNGDLNEKGCYSTSQALKSDNATHLVDMLVLYVDRSVTLILRNARVLLSILNLMKALWQGAAQYFDILKAIRKCKMFWKQLSESVILISRKEAPLPINLAETEAQKLSYEYQCQSAALDIMALEIFLQKKLMHVKSLMRQTDQSLKEGIGGVGNNAQGSAESEQLEDILLSWSDTPCLSNLLKSSAACMYDTDVYLQAKIAFGLLVTHIIGKLATGDSGSMSLSFIADVTALSTKLFKLPAFSELCTQYAQHGYSEGIHIKNLILNDLYYHLQGELEGRDIEHGAFKELSQFLSSSNLLQTYQKKCVNDYSAGANNAYLFDLWRLQRDIGLHIWDCSEWKASKKIAENTLFYVQRANSMLLILGSRLPALRALVTILTLDMGDSVNKQKSMLKKISRDRLLACVDHECNELQTTLGLLTAASDAPPQEVLNYVAAQTELLLCLVRHVDSGMPSPTCLVILKTCGFGVKKLLESRLFGNKVKQIIRSLLMLLHLVVDHSSHSISSSSTNGSESEVSTEVINNCLAILPILCSCTEIPDQSITLATIDLIIKRLLAPSTWLPIIQQHLQLQQLIVKLHDQSCFESLPVIMKFLLTLASVKGGAEMIVASGFLSSLRVLFAEISNGCVANWVKPEKSTMVGAEIEKPQFIWGLGLAVLTETICSLGETSLRNEVVDNMISYFFSEKAYLIAYHLSIIPSDDHDKKRARAQKRKTSLSAFREMEHTLMLLCILAKHRNSWVKATKEMGSELRGSIIHLLAFISRSHRLGESSGRPVPLLCAPMSKEENDYYKKPSFVNSRNGWFAAAALGCAPAASLPDEYSQTAIVVKDQVNGNAESGRSTYFSDTVAVQIYNITFLILKFLLLQAKDAAGRAEELGFIDLSHFPELPDPEILHCLQDQTIAIVTEVCESNRSKQIQPDTQAVCLLLLKIVEMALYLEHCVSQICGIRPVMGRVEDFSKQMRFLVRATEGQAFMNSSMKHLKQIVSFVYPGLLQNEGIL